MNPASARSTSNEPFTAPNPAVARFSLNVEQVDGFEFRVRFDKDQYEDLILDEPAPLGRDSAPNAARILAAAVGNCLSASLVFCLKRAGIALDHLDSDVEVELVRNPEKRIRIGHVDVTLHPRMTGERPDIVACMDKFEDFCIVTQSVRQGLDVRVHMDWPSGQSPEAK
jgi:organic hydroperoxide reductase OsmC/OhrA